MVKVFALMLQRKKNHACHLFEDFHVVALGEHIILDQQQR